jgi:hypothetical protein
LVGWPGTTEPVVPLSDLVDDNGEHNRENNREHYVVQKLEGAGRAVYLGYKNKQVLYRYGVRD